MDDCPHQDFDLLRCEAKLGKLEDDIIPARLQARSENLEPPLPSAFSRNRGQAFGERLSPWGGSLMRLMSSFALAFFTSTPRLLLSWARRPPASLVRSSPRTPGEGDWGSLEPCSFNSMLLINSQNKRCCVASLLEGF